MKWSYHLAPLAPFAAVVVGCSLLGCHRNDTVSQAPPPPGHPMDAKSHLLSGAAEALQQEAPVHAIHQHVCGFHFYSGTPGRQVRAHHFCAHLNEEFLQCVIYDSGGRDAKLIGIEYIISRRLFESLPPDEKKYWHSHRYEVLSGQLIAPQVPDMAEKEVMKKLVETYGKTWHTWQVDRGDTLPLGTPKLMMGFTADGQANAALVSQRDSVMGTDTAAKRASRRDLPSPEIAPGADSWQTGEAFQIPD